MKFIQFIGTQRSGSNLLRIMLNQLEEVSAPHPPHILKIFTPLLPLYGDLTIQLNFEKLVDNVCTWVESNPVIWHKKKFNRSIIIENCREHSLIELFYQIYAYFGKICNSEFVCCKSMSNVYHYEALDSLVIDSYFIYLYRDGRDVACSFKKTIVGEKHIYSIAKQWKSDQEKSIEVSRKIPSNRFISVNYRNLITNPKIELKRICSFLNVNFNEKMLDYFHAEESINTAKSGEMWENLSRPIMKINYNKYLKELDKEEIKIFENIAGDLLVKLGFDLSSDNKNLQEITQLQIENYDSQNDLLKKKSITKARKHDLELRCPQKDFLEFLTNQLSLKKLQLNNAKPYV